MPDQGCQTDRRGIDEEIVRRWRRLAQALSDSRPLNQGRGLEDWENIDHRMQTLELEVERLRYLVSDLFAKLAEIAGST